MKSFSQFLSEAPLLTSVRRKQKFSYETGHKLSLEDAGTKIGRINTSNDLYHNKIEGLDLYYSRNKNTGIVHLTITGKRNPTTKVYTIDTADSDGQGPKAHIVYRKILESGHSVALVGKSHSEGGQKIWQNLAKERGISIHGWYRGKAININARDPEETHVSEKEALAGFLKRDKAGKEIYKMKLVASLHKRKTI
jgi:hypothetical protein